MVVVNCKCFGLPINNRSFGLITDGAKSLLLVVDLKKLFVGNPVAPEALLFSVVESVSRDLLSVVAASVFLACG